MAKRKSPWGFTKLDCGFIIMGGTVVAATPWVFGNGHPYALQQTIFGLAAIAFGVYMMRRT